MALFFYKEKNKDIRAAAYLRLSIEDGDKAESNSIGNQRELIRDFAAERPGLHLVEEYADDGYTGTNFERPGFKRMMEDIKSGKINCIIVKDLSRLGRNYIEMGKYLEQIFPMMGIRLEELIAAKERELAKISRYKQSLYQDWKDGEITQQDYRDMKADYERQTIALTDVLARLNAERAELANGVKSEHPALVAFTKHQNIDQLSRELLVELIDHIKVYENGNISVRFKFADEFRRIAEYIEINTTKPAVAG